MARAGRRTITATDSFAFLRRCEPDQVLGSNLRPIAPRGARERAVSDVSHP